MVRIPLSLHILMVENWTNKSPVINSAFIYCWLLRHSFFTLIKHGRSYFLDAYYIPEIGIGSLINHCQSSSGLYKYFHPILFICLFVFQMKKVRFREANLAVSQLAYVFLTHVIQSWTFFFTFCCRKTLKFSPAIWGKKWKKKKSEDLVWIQLQDFLAVESGANHSHSLYLGFLII